MNSMLHSRLKPANSVFVGAILSILALSSTLEATTVTSFESGEGFTTGRLHGQGGWTAPDSNLFMVSDAEAFSGTQSLAVSSGSNLAATPDLTSLGYKSLTYHFKASSVPQPGAGVFSRARVLLGTESGVTATLEFNIRRVSAGTEISVWSWDDSDTRSTQWLMLDSSFNSRNWNAITVSFNASDLTYSLSVGGETLSGAAALSLPSAVTTDTVIKQLQIFNHTASAYSGTMYYDTLTAPSIPEASFTAMAILAATATVALRSLRKRSGKAA